MAACALALAAFAAAASSQDALAQDVFTQGAPMALSADAQRVPLWRSLQTLPDAAGALAPADADAQIDAGHGAPMPRADATLGRWLPHPYWARFALHNPDAHTRRWLLAFEQPTQDDTALWTRDAPAPPAGAIPPAAWLPVALSEDLRAHAVGTGHLYPVWRIELEPGETRTYLLRIDGHNLIRFPLYALGPEAFARQQQALHLGLGFVLAVPLVVVLYVLTLVRVADDRSLPIFLAMAACEMVGATWVSGLLHELLPWVDRWATGWIGWAGYTAMLGLSCQHARVFMQTRERDPLAHVLLRGGAVAWFVGVPLVVAIWPSLVRVTLVTGGTLHAFAMTWLALRGLRRQRGAAMALFVSVWGVYAVSALLYVLYRVAHLPVYVSLMSSFVQGSLVAALLGCAVSLQITRRRAELQQQVEREHDRGLLYAAAHHDLWQPLQSIGLYAQSLPAADPAQREQLVRRMNAALGAVNDFMAGLHQLSGHGRMRIELRRTQLHDAMAPVIDEYRQWCQTKHIALRYRAVHATVHTDVQQLRRIVRNLLSNALRYTAPGGRILLGFRRRRGLRWLVVLDTGAGMTQEQADQCFQAFRRFVPEHKVPEGMGLGLFSVKQAAHALGQRTWLRSAPGKGTAVWVSLDSRPARSSDRGL